MGAAEWSEVANHTANPLKRTVWGRRRGGGSLAGRPALTMRGQGVVTRGRGDGPSRVRVDPKLAQIWAGIGSARTLIFLNINNCVSYKAGPNLGWQVDQLC